ncbi:tetratricopeptide repeat protein [Halomonas salifodinae]|uniref:Tetratricopeptide repeat protein n=1 Tax=Halomonas salifodinae TaxID=438745 RepID=A0ABW2ERR4_9GAMM
MRRVGIGVLAALLLVPLSGWALDAETQAAKDEGMRLYNAHLRSQAPPYLEPAAEAGDAEAMYYLGEIHRLRHMGMTQEALEWYRRAAEHGEPYAMLRLHQGGACHLGDVCPEGGDDWRQAALEATLPLAEAGDPGAMGVLFDIYSALEQPQVADDWLERAGEAGDAESQYWLGILIGDGLGDYPDEAQRQEAAEAWLRRAAEQGHAPAMNRLSALMNQKGQYEEAWEWMVQASEAGHMNGRLGVGWCYLNPEERGEICVHEQDMMKGWAVLSAVSEETDNRTAQSIMRRNRDRLTDEQREEAEALAEEWLAREPPLSEFPPRFGY